MKTTIRPFSTRAAVLLACTAVLLAGLSILLLQNLLFDQKPFWALLLLAAGAVTLGLVTWFWLVLPFKRHERLLKQFLDGYDLPNQHGLWDCPFSPTNALMLKQVQELLNPSRLFSINKRQAQYLALQNQINPHFLYNTLESIRSEALIAKLDIVADMTEALAAFFRYTISKVENLVSVEEELQNCETYFRIQQYRFGSRLALDIHFNPEEREEIFRCRLPKLTMQPIMENSIIHGTELKIGTGHLSIHLERTQKRLLIRISDDGVGMDEETLNRLNDQLGKGGLTIARQQQEHKGGLALINVDSRIRLLFGDAYGLHVYSTPSVGTDVEITLPAITSDREIENTEALA
ncbi:MAG: sensor histidine kinase [Clostridia bacterium]